MITIRSIRGPFVVSVMAVAACAEPTGDEGMREDEHKVKPKIGRASLVIEPPPGYSPSELTSLASGSNVSTGGKGHGLEFGRTYELEDGRACVSFQETVDGFWSPTRIPGYVTTACLKVPNGQTFHLKPSTLRFAYVPEKVRADFGEESTPEIGVVGGGTASPVVETAALSLMQRFHMRVQYTTTGFGRRTHEVWTSYPPVAASGARQKFVVLAGRYDATLGFDPMSGAPPFYTQSVDVGEGATVDLVLDPPEELRATVRVDAPVRELPTAEGATPLRISVGGAIAASVAPSNDTSFLRWYPQQRGLGAGTKEVVAEVNGTKMTLPAPDAGAEVVVPLRRIDVDHMEDADGAAREGTYRIDVFEPISSDWRSVPRWQARMPTGTGLDLLPGRYVVDVLAGSAGHREVVDL